MEKMEQSAPRIVDMKELTKNQAALMSAVREQNIKDVQELLNGGTNPNFEDKNGRSPLDGAAFKGNTDIAKLLINKGATASKEDGKYSPLHHAADMGHVEMIQLLLDKGARIEALDAQDCTPLEIALDENRVQAAELLMQRGAKFDESMWHVVRRTTTLDLVLKYGANINACLDKDMTPLHYAIREGDFYLAIELIKRGANAHFRDGEGLAPLHRYATSFDFDSDDERCANGLELVMMLKDQLQVFSGKWQTALDVAIKERNWGTVTLLIKLGATIDSSGIPNRGFGLANALGERENLSKALKKAMGTTTKKRSMESEKSGAEIRNSKNQKP